MACENPCSNCDRKGLPILFTRYAVAYSAQDKSLAALRQLAPLQPFESTPSGVALKTAVYGVRMLRAGYLYLRLAQRGRRAPQWWGFAVHPHGYLTQFVVSQPQSAQAQVACERDARQANNCLVWIPDAKNVTALHYLFHPDVIDYQRLMSEIEPKRDRYMQKFDVAAWAKGANAQPHSSTPDKLAAQVAEFSALQDPQIAEAFEGQFFGLMGTNPQERGWGSYQEQRHGRHFHTTSAGAAMGPAVGAYIATVTNPSYEQKHGPRLKQMVEFLQKNKGAVLACADPIGIAQSLAMGLPMAAGPYDLWLHSAPDKENKDFPKLTNGWLVAASESIDEMLGAMKQGLTESLSSKLQARKKFREGPAKDIYIPSSGVDYGPDGVPVQLSAEQARARLLARLDAQIAEMQADLDASKVPSRAARADMLDEHQAAPDTSRFDPKDTLNQARQLFDQSKLEDFNKVHQSQLKALDERLETLAHDLIAWLDAPVLFGVLERYNGKDPDQGGDGERFALQMAVALLNLDSTSAGRHYLGKANPFVYARDNLVARVIGCNSEAVSNEIRQACERLTVSEQANAQVTRPRELQKERLRQLDEVGKTIDSWGKVIKSANETNKLLDHPSEHTRDKFKAVFSVQAAIKAAAGAGWPSVLFAAATLFAVRVGGSEKEKTLLGAKALAYAQGLGSDAQKLLKVERVQLAKKIANANPQVRVSVGGPREWQAEAADLQRSMDKAVQNSGVKSIVGKMRVSALMLIADALGTLVGSTAKAGIKRDARTALETAGQYLTLMGSFRNLRTALSEEMVFKTVVTSVTDDGITVAQFAQGTKLDQVATRQLLKFRQAAGRFTIAGASTMVGLDAFDGVRAIKDDKIRLGLAYLARAGGGMSTITGVGIAMFTIRYVTLVARLNLAGIIFTVTSTIVIEMLKAKLWQDWFRSQPFRLDSDNTDGSLGQWFAKPAAHRSEAQMLSKLDEATGDVKQKKA